jgi:hypothetical protein
MKAATQWPTGLGKKSKLGLSAPFVFQLQRLLSPLTFSAAQLLSASSLVTGHLSLHYLGQAARSFAAISLYSASGSFLLGAGVPGAFPPNEGMT